MKIRCLKMEMATSLVLVVKYARLPVGQCAFRLSRLPAQFDGAHRTPPHRIYLKSVAEGKRSRERLRKPRTGSVRWSGPIPKSGMLQFETSLPVDSQKAAFTGLSNGLTHYPKVPASVQGQPWNTQTSGLWSLTRGDLKASNYKLMMLPGGRYLGEISMSN